MLFYVSCGILGVTWVGVLWLVKKLHDSYQENIVYWEDMTDEEKKEYLDDEIDDYMSHDPRRKKEE